MSRNSSPGLIELRAALLRAARRITDEDNAQDLVQETLMKIMTREGVPPPGGQQKAWALTALRHQFVDEKRRAQRFPHTSSSDQLPGRNSLHGPALQYDLERAVESLDPSLLSCFQLVVVSQERYVDAAQQLAVPVGTIRSRVARLRRLLQGRLVGYSAAS